MKEKNGFTLIELLAILVILAVIAVIAIPIILNVIANSEKGAAQDSAYGYKDAVEKYYITSNMINNGLKMNGAYVVTNGSLDGDLIDNVQIPASGSVPTSGYLIYNNNILSNGCLVLNEYKVIYQNGQFISNGKGSCSIDGDFENDSWSTIVSNLKIDRHAYDDQVCAEKEIEIDGLSYTVRLANTSSCPNDWPEEASQTACGVVIEFIDLIKNLETGSNGYIFDSSSSNIDGWPESSIRTYLNDVVFNALPDALKGSGVILNTNVVSGHGSQQGASNFTSSDKLYLLSYAELWGSDSGFSGYDTVKEVGQEITDGTRQFECYQTGNYSHQKKSLDQNLKLWWLRSAYSGNSNWFLIVNQYGNSLQYEGPTFSKGVAPAFRLAE